MQHSLNLKRGSAPCRAAQRSAPALPRVVLTKSANTNAAGLAPVVGTPTDQAAAKLNEGLGFQTMREGVKVAAGESILTPRFYTTGVFQPAAFQYTQALLCTGHSD